MDTSTLIYALKISGIGIVVLLLVLIILAGIVSLMTRFIVDKPEKEEEVVEEVKPAQVAAPKDDKKDLAMVAAIALAVCRAQTEMQSVETAAPAGEVNAWKQFNLQRRLAQSSNFRRTR